MIKITKRKKRKVIVLGGASGAWDYVAPPNWLVCVCLVFSVFYIDNRTKAIKKAAKKGSKKNKQS